MASYRELNESKRQLDKSLGRGKKAYFKLLKKWFQMKSTRQEFYTESRKLLSGEQVRLHNAFLLNLFNTCQFPIGSRNVPIVTNKPLMIMTNKPVMANKPNSAPREKDKYKEKSKKSKSRKRTKSEKGNFEHADRLEYLQLLHPLPSQARDEPIRYCHQELFLPDVSHMRGRLLIAAWEHGMEGAGEKEAEYLVIAVQFFLKNILTSIFSQRSGYKVREACFQYQIGTSVPNPMLQNTSRNTIEERKLLASFTETREDGEGIQVPKLKCSAQEIERQAVFEISASMLPITPKAPVSALDLLEALQADRIRIPIPSHTVYSINIARIIARLNHPTREELEGGRARDAE